MKLKIKHKWSKHKKLPKFKIEKVAKAYGKSKRKWIINFSVFAFCLIFGIVFLYQPAKNCYLSVRENDKLQAQLELIKKTNSQLNKDIDFLNTDEGIKQKASENLGLIEKGESIGVVQNSEQEDIAQHKSSLTSSKLAYRNIKAPTKWYSKFCDFIFGITE